MLRTRPTSQATGTGWALFDWDYHATRAQLTYRAGNMDSVRLQFDAYRRFIHIPQWAAEITFWCWSQNDFRLQQWRRGIGPDVLAWNHYPQAWPQSIEVANDIRIREYRLPNNPTGPWGAGAFQNLFATTPVQMTIANRFFGVFNVIATPEQYAFDPYATRVEVFQPGTKSTVRILAVGHHNETWRTGGITQ